MIRFLRSLLPKRTRYVHATKAENSKAARKRQERTDEYRAKVATLTPEQRKAAYDRALTCRADAA